MGTLNRVINILILLSAITAAVFSYLLFSKREKLVNGWTQMASAISVAAKTLDDGGVSGTTAARDLAEAKLKHTGSGDLAQVLPKLSENISKVVKQRNDLSNAMQIAAESLSISDVKDTYLKSVVAYKAHEQNFLKGVQNFRRSHDAVSKEYANTLRQFGEKISVNDLNHPQKYLSAISRGNMKIKDALNRRNAYASTLKEIAEEAGVTAPKIEGVTYRRELKKTVTAIKKLTRELSETKKLLEDERLSNSQLNDKLRDQRKNLDKYDKIKIANEKEIKRLNNILTKDNSKTIPKKLLTAKDPECYQHVTGVIEYIDKDYGFITINIGKKYSFIQEYGTVQNRVFFPLQAGKIMTVVRNMNSTNPLYIGKVIVTKVDDNSSVCNLVSGKVELMQEGDTVQFTDEDIEKAMAGKPNPAKK